MLELKEIQHPILYLEKNPSFGELVQSTRRAKHVSKAFDSPISAGKNTYVYDAHTYHTKVPPEGIKALVEHYTNPGDVILDPFCGSGMTGVAALELGREVLLCDLSPAAVFITYNLNTPIDANHYLNAVKQLIVDSEDLERKLYITQCRDCSKEVPTLYTVWSYGVICIFCSKEFRLWNAAKSEKRSVRESKILSEFPCPHCNKTLHKRGLKRTRRYPVQIGYKCCGRGLKESCVDLNDFDQRLLSEIETAGIPSNLWYPTDHFPVGINTRQPIAAGITSIEKCYTTRALYAFAYLWSKASQWPDESIREKLLFTLTSLYKRITVFSEFRFWGGSGNTAHLNVPGIMNEQNVFRTFARKANTISWYFKEAPRIDRHLRVSTQSACELDQLPDKSVDYIFTDPPFGGNINYSEMNFLWESWLRKFTNNEDEAIVNEVQGKSYQEYQFLLCKAFKEAYRVLKDEAWLTVVFHNSSEKAWNAIQNSLNGAGFQVQGTQIFDKKHGTFKMFVSENAVGYDLVLHCQKSTGAADLSIDDQSKFEDHALNFIRVAMTKPADYVVKYLHVSRESEFDYRRLYSEWLAQALPKTRIHFSFESFRQLVDSVWNVKTL